MVNFETPDLDEAGDHGGDHEAVDDRVGRVVDQDGNHSVQRKENISNLSNSFLGPES